MRISLITVCYNSAATIRTALDSVFAQQTPAGLEIEYLVIDGGSTDGTVEILKEYASRLGSAALRSAGSGRPSEGIPGLERSGNRRSPRYSAEGLPEEALPSMRFSFRYLSEKDNGMYDALNKGIKLSTGDIIGWLNADDALASDDILSRIASAFSSDPTLDGTYGDIRFVHSSTSTTNLNSVRAERTLRYCSGKRFRPWMFRFGTQTAHPSTFFRRSCFDRWGFYSLDFGMFGDFELLCRFIWRHRARMRYLPLCTTVMRSGGASTNGWRTTLKINRTDLRALKANGCWSCYAFLYARYFFKIWGFLFK